MINRQNLWFLTLFSLILVLSVYYITMPTDVNLANPDNVQPVEQQDEDDITDKQDGTDVQISVEESNLITTLRLESDNETQKMISDLLMVLTDVGATVDEKNAALEEIYSLRANNSMEYQLEDKVKKEIEKDVFVKITGNQVRVVVDSDEHNFTLANNIMRSIQAEYDEKMYISVEFKDDNS